ncbi:MAG: tripartite tricarboxylate transporter substrate-binding protein [Alphaproteobacteria bacterium]
MRITRRAALASAMLPLAARAQAPEWPSRPVRFIVPYPPGGPTDIMGRIVAQAVQGPLGQPFVVENRAGANGLIGSEQAARAAPDGSTFLVNASAHVIVPHLTPNMPIDVLADFAPVTNIAAVPLWLVVNPALPVRSVAEFIAYARANPGKIAYASSSQGGAPHLAGELFKLMTGTDLVHVPYRGSGPAGQDLIAGTVQAMFDSVVQDRLAGPDQSVVTNARHVQALQEVAGSLQRIRQGLETGLSGDLLSVDIKACLYHLGEITGEVTSEDKLDYIFSKFCIGK